MLTNAKRVYFPENILIIWNYSDYFWKEKRLNRPRAPKKRLENLFRCAICYIWIWKVL